MEILAERGETSYETPTFSSAKISRHTAAYDLDCRILHTAQVGESKPEKLTLTYDLKQPMRY